jgi:two-component system chemotaxis response regulator CheY
MHPYRSGIPSHQAEHGRDAINKVTDGPKMDLVVTDLNMPEMDGIALIKELRNMPSSNSRRSLC